MISMKMGQNDGVYWFIIDNFFDVNKSFLGSLMTFKSVNQYTTLIPFSNKVISVMEFFQKEYEIW